jgi:hypothetical protein
MAAYFDRYQMKGDAAQMVQAVFAITGSLVAI